MNIEKVALACADEFISIVEAAERNAKRTGNSFVLDRRRVAGMIAGRFSDAMAPSIKHHQVIAWRTICGANSSQWIRGECQLSNLPSGTTVELAFSESDITGASDADQ